MDDVILTMYENYFKALEEGGHINKGLLNLLIVLDFINEVSNNEDVLAYLEDDDLIYLDKYIKCFNNCLNTQNI